MSHGNADAFRRLIGFWNGRDADAMAALAAADVEFVNAPLAVEPGTRRGRDEYAAVMRAQWKVLGDARLEIESLDTTGDDVFALLRITRSFGGGGTPLAQTIGTHVTFRDGLLVRQAMLAREDLEQARSSAGAGPERPG